jgi:hypothetical protein
MVDRTTSMPTNIAYIDLLERTGERPALTEPRL